MKTDPIVLEKALAAARINVRGRGKPDGAKPGAVEKAGDGSSKKLEGADFKEWARRDTWHIAEGAMLILGFQPHERKTDWWPPRGAPPGFLNICETAQRSRALTAKGRAEVSPPDFLAWAREKEYPIPEELEEAVNRFPPIGQGRPQGGADGQKWPWGSHETKLLQDLAAAADRFWKNYDPSDPTTAPTNDQVIDWLMKRDVAQRNAEVIATILRADGLRTGPRK